LSFGFSALGVGKSGKGGVSCSARSSTRLDGTGDFGQQDGVSFSYLVIVVAVEGGSSSSEPQWREPEVVVVVLVE
jgi:hypothetical protein